MPSDHPMTSGREPAARSGSRLARFAGACALALAATSLTVAPATPAGAVASAVRPSEHRMFYEIEYKSHSWTMAQAIAHARAFDTIIAVPQAYTPEMVAAMRAANPALVLAGYNNGTLAQHSQKDTYPSSWYIRDPQGNKIMNDWNLWLMDPGNPAWVQNRLDECRKVIAKSHYNGCYLDNMGYGFIKYNPLTGKPINPRTRTFWTYADWQKAASAEAAYINSQMPGVAIVANGLVDGATFFGDPSSSSLLSASDAAVSEVFIRGSRDSISWTPSTAAWKQDLDMVVRARQLGKPIHVTTKIWIPASTQQIKRWHDLAAATFLLGTDGHVSSFHFSSARYELPNLTGGNIARIGTPIADYQVVAGAYLRKFVAGIVVVNPTTETRTVNLGGVYTHDSGQRMSSVTLAPMTGSILTK